MNKSRIRNRHASLRDAAAFAGSALLTLGLALAAGGFLGAGQSAAAAEGADTYVLTDFDVAYPYIVGPRDEMIAPDAELSGDPTKAGVAFTAHWSGARFPGQSLCEVSVYNSSGSMVGRAEFLASYATPTALPPIVAVEVAAPPSTAEGTCGDGSYPSGEGYVFDNVHVEDGPGADQATISFDSHWLGQDAPSWRSCSVVVRLSEGQDVKYEFGYHAPDGSRVTHVVDAQPGQIVEASATCAELGEVEGT